MTSEGEGCFKYFKTFFNTFVCNCLNFFVGLLDEGTPTKGAHRQLNHFDVTFQFTCIFTEIAPGFSFKVAPTFTYINNIEIYSDLKCLKAFLR